MLLDPASCGEDLLHNAARFGELAPLHCSGCADYHIRSAVHRCAGPPKSVFDRPELIQIIRKAIAEVLGRKEGAIEIVMPGCADTAVLATAAHAAATLGSEALGRCRFRVLDRCRTPLTVCAEFAVRHGLDFRAHHSDLASASLPMHADLIVVHSLFRFIPHADQVRLLDRLGDWLSPGGRLVFSNRILLDDRRAESEAEARKRTAANKAALEALAKGILRMSETAEALGERLERAKHDSRERPGEFRSLAEVRALFRKSRLTEISAQSLVWRFAIGPDDVLERRRVLAVLERSHD
ncbi:MAG: hypothetical protein AB7S92_03005 [Parvibaculaceae bacterium]